VFQTITFLSYLLAALAFGASRWPQFSDRRRLHLSVAVGGSLIGLALHGWMLWGAILPPSGLTLSLANAASFIGFQLALVALLGSRDAALRGLSGGLLSLAALTALMTGWQSSASASIALSWQVQAHVLISLFAYGLLTVGAIIAVYALVQDRRLHAARLSPVNHLFAPLETTERLLFGVTSAGFATLLLAVFSGFEFVENIFAQHLVHKTALSMLALLLFGVLLAGRHFAGWRGRAAVYLYLWGFVMLGLAYFGSRFILENVLGRSWN